MANPRHIEVAESGAEAFNERRRRHPNERIDLSGADLSKSDLVGARLSGADLSGANFTGADLRKADLSEADVDGADFREADLGGTNFSDASLVATKFVIADLSKANLGGARLKMANLSGAILSRTNLNWASCHRTIFAAVDLSETIGLDSVKHLGPSTIGVDSLYKSRGKIPESFLRGCGVPENLIAYLPSLSGQAIEYYSCFISHSHEDKSFARRLHDALQGQGIRCWLDEHQMLPGDDIHDQVDRGIRLWDKTLLCASKHSLDSWWVDNEIETAFAKERRIMKERATKVLALVPLDLDGYLFGSWQNGKAQQVKSRIAADFRGWESDNAIFEREFEKVVKSLHTDGAGREPPPVPKL